MKKIKNKRKKRKEKKSLLQRFMEKMAGMRGNPIKMMEPELDSAESITD